VRHHRAGKLLQARLRIVRLDHKGANVLVEKSGPHGLGITRRRAEAFDDDTRILMTMMLEQSGFRVTAVDSGSKCLKIVEEGERFDLYLMDHTFPDASGVTICEAIRKLDSETPILFYSGRAMPKEKEVAMKAGAQDYLVKPDDLFNVARHVTKWIDARRVRNQE
jgi:CheY-like chemotaxis protein